MLLFNEIKKQCINKDYVKELYMKLHDKNITGWLMLKALYIIKNWKLNILTVIIVKN